MYTVTELPKHLMKYSCGFAVESAEGEETIIIKIGTGLPI